MHQNFTTQLFLCPWVVRATSSAHRDASSLSPPKAPRAHPPLKSSASPSIRTSSSPPPIVARFAILQGARYHPRSRATLAHCTKRGAPWKSWKNVDFEELSFLFWREGGRRASFCVFGAETPKAEGASRWWVLAPRSPPSWTLNPSASTSAACTTSSTAPASWTTSSPIFGLGSFPSSLARTRSASRRSAELTRAAMTASSPGFSTRSSRTTCGTMASTTRSPSSCRRAACSRPPPPFPCRRSCECCTSTRRRRWVARSGTGPPRRQAMPVSPTPRVASPRSSWAPLPT